MSGKRRLTKKQLRRRKAYIKLYMQIIGLLMPIICAIIIFIIMISNMIAYDNKENDGVKAMADSDTQNMDNVEKETEESSKDEDTFSENGSDTGEDDKLLVLVNKLYKLPDDYTIELHELNNGELVAECMYEDLKAMWFDGEEQNPGFSYDVCSGYRSAEKQKMLLEQEIEDNIKMGMSEEEAEADALLTVAPSGYSEHETGLAVDIVSENNQRLDDTQELTAENKWLQEHCYEYGFILRYPKGKESVTGYSYESWHFRYVGRDAAKEIHDRGITLEEYLAEYK